MLLAITVNVLVPKSVDRDRSIETRVQSVQSVGKRSRRDFTMTRNRSPDAKIWNFGLGLGNCGTCLLEHHPFLQFPMRTWAVR